MRCKKNDAVPALILATLVALAVGCWRDAGPPEPVPHGVIQLPSVMPQADYKALEVKPELTAFPAGALIRVEGEFDAAAASGPVKLVSIEVRQQRRGKAVIVQTERTEVIDSGRYRLTVTVPEEPGEYELSIRARDRFIGRTRVRAVKPHEA
jgi:hypothetical protein